MSVAPPGRRTTEMQDLADHVRALEEQLAGLRHALEDLHDSDVPRR